MTAGDGPPGNDAPNKASSSGEAGRERRLDDLERRLDEANRRRDELAGRGKSGRAGGDPSGMARALRMSSEFVGGVVVGGGIGWAIDKALGTSPWGLIVFFLLGFAAGILSLMRAAGMAGGPPRSGGKG